jgi:hypothetical protein
MRHLAVATAEVVNVHRHLAARAGDKDGDLPASATRPGMPDSVRKQLPGR